MTPRPTGSSQAGLGAGDILGGRYRLDDTLASGGMAQVWQGTDEVLRRAVAIKVLHPHLTADETFVARFRHEAIAVARLSHPAIVSVYDTCSNDGLEAIVMELVTGSTLRQRLDAGPLDPWSAAYVAAQVAGALEVAHGAGLVHRDIKPANILISEDGRVKVGDFGIAKAAESSTELTQEGSFIGTAKYLAPEQVEGKPVDARTDLYSLGVVLYEMLCGRPPFQADGSSATALARLHSDPTPPRQLRPALPPELEDMTLRLLARNPDDRPLDAGEVRATLTAAIGDSGADPTGPGLIASNSHAARPPMATGSHSPLPPAMPRQPTPPPGPPPNRGDRTEVNLEGPPPEPDRRWLVPTLLVFLVAVSIFVVALLISSASNRTEGTDSPDQSSTEVDGQSTGPLQIADAQDYDPVGDGGDGSEDSEDVGSLIDNDPGTEWRTEGYHDVGIYGSEKPGVGFVLELNQANTISGVEIDSPSTNYDVDIYVGDEVGETVSAWGEPVASQRGVQGNAVIEFDQPAEGAHVLVHFTRTGDEQVSGGYRVVVLDARVIGPTD